MREFYLASKKNLKYYPWDNAVAPLGKTKFVGRMSEHTRIFKVE